jgi:hypothetical protein
MWSIRTCFDYAISESDSRFSGECAQGYIEILEFILDLFLILPVYTFLNIEFLLGDTTQGSWTCYASFL